MTRACREREILTRPNDDYLRVPFLLPFADDVLRVARNVWYISSSVSRHAPDVHVCVDTTDE